MSYDKDNDDLASVCAFPRRLYAIVNNPENHTIINWNDKGDHFIIYNPNEFAEKILTRREFNSANYASFVRQLNMYDFHKVKNRLKEKSDTFYHKYFLKDRSSLLKNVRRKINQMQIDNDDTSKSNIQATSNLGIKRSANNMLSNSNTPGYNLPCINGERIDKLDREQRERQERNDRQFLSQINSIKQDDQPYGNSFNCISNIYNFPQINEISHSFHPNSYSLNSINNTNNNKTGSSFLSGNMRDINLNLSNSNANSNLTYVRSQVDTNNQLSLNTNYQEISNIPNQKSTNKSKEKPGKKANKSLIHTLYTTFLKNVSSK